MPLSRDKNFRLGYRPALDGLRGISVLLVVFFHLGTVSCPGGWIGVDIFFVLSGFLITTILMQEWRDTGKIRLKQFYLRRILRLFPALVTVVLFTVCAFLVLNRGDQWTNLVRDGFLALFYTTNWIGELGINITEPLKHTWSLSTEEQFYLLWPTFLFCLLLLRLRGRLISPILCTLILEFTMLYSLGLAEKWHISFIHPVPGLLLGCLLGFCAVHGFLHARPRWALFWSFLGYGCLGYIIWLAIYPLSPSSWNVWGSSTLNIAVIFLLTSVFTAPESLLAKALQCPPLTGLGQVSYGMYLWHYPIFCLYWEIVGIRGHLLGESLLLAVTLLVTVTSYRFIEKPFLRMKARFESPGKQERNEQKESSPDPNLVKPLP